MSNSRYVGQIRPAMGLDLAHGVALEMVRSSPAASVHPTPALPLGMYTGGGERVRAGGAQQQLVSPSATHWEVAIASWMSWDVQ